MATCSTTLGNPCLLELSDSALRTVTYGAVLNWAIKAGVSVPLDINSSLARASCLMELSDAELRNVIYSSLCNYAGGSSGPPGYTPVNLEVSAFCAIVCNVSAGSTTWNCASFGTGQCPQPFGQALDNLVTTLKTANIWSMFDAIYPFLGATAATCAVNLVNPSNYLITWHGGVTASSAGVQGDGSTGYGDTGFNPSTASGANYSLNSASIGVDFQATAGQYTQTLIGSSDPANENAYLFLNNATTPTITVNSGTPSGPAISGSGQLYMSRTASSGGAYVVPGGSGTFSTASATVPQQDFYILANNYGGTVNQFYPGLLSFCFIGGGFTQAQLNAIASAIATFQASLSRS